MMDSTQHPLHAIGQAVQTNTAQKLISPLHSGCSSEDQRFGHNSARPGVESAIMPKSLGLAGLQTPALILDSEMRVFWQNRLAVDQIWHHACSADNGKPMPFIFDLLFDPQFQHAVDNWRQWAAFFVHHLSQIVPRETLENRIEQINPKQKSIVSALAERMLNSTDVPAGCLRQVLRNGEFRLFRVVSLDFNEGRLLSFEATATESSLENPMRTHDVVRRFERILRQPNPIKIAYSILCASLDQAALLKIELLSYEYCILITQLCNRCIAVIERFGGVFRRNSDSGFSACFLPADESNDNTSDVIDCALALKKQMAELSREWRVRRAWPHELALNIGIHQEHEYVGILTTSLGACLTSFGNAVDVSCDLSRLARNGQILATKALINDMSVSDRKRLTFGIFRPGGNHHQILQQNGFSTVQDLPGIADLSSGILKETGATAVTQILDFNSAC
jgi:class 3 adenylate cyclase